MQLHSSNGLQIQVWLKENLAPKSLIAQISAEDLDSETFGSKGIRLVNNYSNNGTMM